MTSAATAHGEKIPAITHKTFAERAARWLRIITFKECGLVINFVGDHFYTLPQVLADSALLKKTLDSKYTSAILVYLEMSSTPSLIPLQTSLLKVLNKKKIFLPNMHNLEVEELISALLSKGFSLTVLLSRAEYIFATNGEPLLQKLEQFVRRYGISIIYFAERNLTNIQFQMQQQNYPSVFQNVVYLPIYGITDTKQFITYNEHLWSIKVPDKLKTRIIEECGGDLWLIRQAVRYIRNNPNSDEYSIFSNQDLLSKASLVWQQLFPDEQDVVQTLISRKKTPPERQYIVDYLLQINFLRKENDHHSLTIPLLKSIIQQKQELQGLVIKDNLIYLGEKILSLELTRSEELMLKYFLTHKNMLLSREDVAFEVWPDGDYTDWALDRLISRLRKSLTSCGLSQSLIKTKKGKGYIFTDHL